MPTQPSRRFFLFFRSLLKTLKDNGFDYFISDDIRKYKKLLTEKVSESKFLVESKLCKKSDVIISIGGDGTMLATAFHAHFYDKPVLGVNLGKLGFLVDANVDQLDRFIVDLKNNRYSIEERMVIDRNVCRS